MKDAYYFDHAATSFPKAPGVAEAMAGYLTDVGSNISRGDYPSAYAAAARVLEVRERLARRFGAPESRNVVFTPGCTYALNTVLKGLLRPGDRVAASVLEHNAVLRPSTNWKNRGWRWCGCPVTAKGPWS